MKARINNEQTNLEKLFEEKLREQQAAGMIQGMKAEAGIIKKILDNKDLKIGMKITEMKKQIAWVLNVEPQNKKK